MTARKHQTPGYFDGLYSGRSRRRRSEMAAPPEPFSEDTDVSIEWETGSRCYVQIDGHDVVVLEFVWGESTVSV